MILEEDTVVGSNVIYVNCYPDNLAVGVSIRLGSQSLLYTVVALAEPATQNRRRLADGLPIFLEQEVIEVINSGQDVIIVTDDDSSNLGLILGLSIGLGVVALLLLIYIVYMCRPEEDHNTIRRV